MTTRSHFPFSGLLLSLLASLLLVPFLVASAQADGGSPHDPSPSGHAAKKADPQEVAEQALETVEGLIDGAAPLVDDATHPAPVNPVDPGASTGDSRGSKELTLALRDLAARLDDLPADKQDDAQRILARPDGSAGGCDSLACWSRSADDHRKCSTRVCLHWVSTSADKATGRYAAKALDVANSVAARYVAAGYRAPKNDAGRGGNWKLDVYLADLGDAGAYGYCTTDSSIRRHASYAAYCVLDNDYAASQYGTATSATGLLKVTAAHELFHAVQFNYDALEDLWFMEATATWVEDEVYDAVNDNRFYLRYGPMGHPDQPLDLVNGAPEYGAWIFFRFLTERFPHSSHGLPVLVRKMWEKSVGGGDTHYSVWAIRSVLADRGTNVSDQYSSFVARNRQAKRYYEEGAAYPVVAPAQTNTLRASAPSKSLIFRLRHLSGKTLRYVPSGAMGDTWKLRIDVDVNDQSVGGAVIVTVKRPGKAPTMERVPLSYTGTGTSVRGFGSLVDWIEVSVANTDTRYDCGSWAGTSEDYLHTCAGDPLEQQSNAKGPYQKVNVTAFHS